MFNNAKRLLWSAALLAGASAPAVAADLYEPPIYEAPVPVYYEETKKVSHGGGWYLRGDLDYHWTGWRGGDYITYGVPLAVPGTNYFRTGSLRPAFSLGGGVGYQASKYFRADFTADYWFRSQFRGTTGDACGAICTEESHLSALVLMANAYAELGKFGRFTPYVGAGIGGARVNWGELRNTSGTAGTVVHAGATNWRFAWSLMAGTSYCITNNLKADVGYRYTRIAGGRMFEYAAPAVGVGAGPGFDRGFNVHEARAGLRYQFGGGTSCGPKKQETYVQYEPEPIFPAVYK